jgi:hypothetical protein
MRRSADDKRTAIPTMLKGFSISRVFTKANESAQAGRTNNVHLQAEARSGPCLQDAGWAFEAVSSGVHRAPQCEECDDEPQGD